MSDYREYAPPASLRPFVRVLWTYSAPEPDTEIQRIVPDGCAELIIHRGAPYEEGLPDGGWQLQPKVLFAGQLTRPLLLRASGPVDVLAVRFEPDGARDFLGFDLSKATDRRVALNEELPSNLEALIAALETRARTEGWAIDPSVRQEVQAIQADRTPPERSASAQRAAQRRFLSRVGVSRKALRSVMRFRNVFERASQAEGEAMAWLDAGLEAGYFDQPQMARDFNRYLGCSATVWAQQELALARRLASAPTP